METLRIKKRYGIYWYKHKCRCGNIHYIPLLFLNIKFSFKKQIYYKCRKCGYILAIRNMGFIATDTTDKQIKVLNKDFKDEKTILKELWSRG